MSIQHTIIKMEDSKRRVRSGTTSSMSDDEDRKIPPPLPTKIRSKIRSKIRRTGQKNKKLSTRRKSEMEDSKRRAISARRLEVGSIIFVLDQGELVWVNV